MLLGKIIIIFVHFWWRIVIEFACRPFFYFIFYIYLLDSCDYHTATLVWVAVVLLKNLLEGSKRVREKQRMREVKWLRIFFVSLLTHTLHSYAHAHTHTHTHTNTHKQQPVPFSDITAWVQRNRAFQNHQMTQACGLCQWMVLSTNRVS